CGSRLARACREDRRAQTRSSGFLSCSPSSGLILSAIEQGDPSAAAQLLPLVYDELRKLAAQKLALEKPGQTLQATALVHEAYLRLVGGEEPAWDSRGHFFAAAAEAMRRIVVETARRKKLAAALPPAAHAADPQHRRRPATPPRPARGGQHDADTRLCS